MAKKKKKKRKPGFATQRVNTDVPADTTVSSTGTGEDYKYHVPCPGCERDHTTVGLGPTRCSHCGQPFIVGR